MNEINWDNCDNQIRADFREKGILKITFILFLFRTYFFNIGLWVSVTDFFFLKAQ